MKRAIIGHSGFVGSTLQKQQIFDNRYRSANIGDIVGQRFDLVVCAAAPGKKWIANRAPEADRQNIERLIGRLKTVKSRIFVLISTVDVFRQPLGVNESMPVDEDGVSPYGLNRRMLESFVENHFPDHLIVRLPGLVGPGLRKNVIFDFLNNNNLHAIDSRGIFQFYPMVNLWYDIQIALQAGLKLVHLTAEPISVSEVSEAGFGKPFSHVLGNTPVAYDFQSDHAALFGGQGRYQYSRRETIQAIRTYAQSEPVTLKAGSGTA